MTLLVFKPFGNSDQILSHLHRFRDVLFNSFLLLFKVNYKIMAEFKHEIGSEITKVYKTRFQFTIEKFLLKMNVVSHLDIDIPGLTTW